MKKFLFPLVLGTIFTSCSTLNPFNKFKNGKKYDSGDLIEYEEIEGDENVVAVSAIFGPSVNMISPDVMMNFDFGGEIKYHNMRYGELTVQYSKPIAFKQSYSKFDYYISEQLINQHQFLVAGSFPLYKERFETKEHFVPGYDDYHKRYYVITPTNGLRKYNLRLGFEQDYRRTYTDAYTNQLDSEFDEVNYSFSFEHPYAEYNLSQQQLRIGASYESCYNTTLTLTKEDGTPVYGRSAMSQKFYFDVLISTGASADQVLYDYEAEENSNTTDYSENIDLTEVISKRPIGIAIGYEYLAFDSKIKFYQSGYLLEVGIQPGYYSTIKKSFYVKFGVKFGFGLWK